MYNSLIALLFKVGIKSETHSGSIIIFDNLFNNKELAEVVSWAKKERIDKQYYVDPKQVTKATKESCDEMIKKAEDFLVKMKLLINEIKNEEITSIRDSFTELFKEKESSHHKSEE